MDNIYKKLREKTKVRAWDKPLTQTELGEKIGLNQQTVSKAEKGYPPSFETIKAYHDYFKVPYETLLGESEAMEVQNVSISKETGLSDEAINNLRNLSPRSLTLLDKILSNEFIDMQLDSLFNYVYSMDRHLQKKGHSELDSNYKMIQYIMSEGFVTYMMKFIRPMLSDIFKKADSNKI